MLDGSRPTTQSPERRRRSDHPASRPLARHGEDEASRALFAVLTPRLVRHQWTMIVTVIAMFMMQETVREIIDMIAMRNPRVPAINMIARALHRRTGSGIVLTYGEHMLVVMLVMREVQMPLMQVINVPLMLDGNMPAIRPMRMDMFGTSIMCHHRTFPLQARAACTQKIAYSLHSAGVSCALLLARSIPNGRGTWSDRSRVRSG